MAKKLTMALSQGLRSAVWAAWGEVSPDAGRCTNAQAVELCLDADRLTTMGGKGGEEADAEVTALIEVHGYPAVARAISKAVKLV